MLTQTVISITTDPLRALSVESIVSRGCIVLRILSVLGIISTRYLEALSIVSIISI